MRFNAPPHRYQWVWLPVAVFALLGWSSPLSAQDADTQSDDGAKTIELDETVIEGRMEKPEAFYILQHSEPNYEVFEAEPTFLPELLKSVEQEPFE